jgi:hypothetical protein
MPLVQGSVTVDNDGNVTSSGLAKSLYDADVATLTLATPPSPGDTSPPYSTAYPAPADVVDQINAANIRALQEAARRANANAAALYTILTTQVHALVTSQSLGTTPNPNNAATAIDPPAAPVDIPLG